MKKTYEEEDDLKELLELEMIREAQILEETLLSDEYLDELNISDDEVQASYEDLVKRLKREGIYRSDEEMENRAKTDSVVEMPHPAEHTDGKEKRFSVGRVAGFVTVVLLSVFAGSMTSEANRQYLVKQLRYLRGDNSQVVVSDDDSDKSNQNEEMAIEQIELKLDIEIPKFYYRPISFKFLSYLIDEKGGFGEIVYDYAANNTKASLAFYNRTSDKSSINFSSHGDGTIELPDQDIEIYIREISNADSETEFDAIWMYQDVLYKFKGRFSREEFEKIVGSMQYSK